MRYVAALGMLAFGIGPALAQTAGGVRITDHRTAIETYIAAFPLALIADDVCPGIKVDGPKLLVLRATANVSDREEVSAKLEMEKIEAGARQAIARTGAATWCREVWAQIGPDGGKVPGLLTRH